ncbi:hypothetical protein AAFF_G00250830 [Aldrovandia affinis]|uniref:Uncharacterized protein n=1 Tax=Aldrovandia affinis TaxID=143900 RepID=A0AAD7RCN1_9TELE|nr:hypothetical protein AAFF_G00250830 [Aldrovandia affinis]
MHTPPPANGSAFSCKTVWAPRASASSHGFHPHPSSSPLTMSQRRRAHRTITSERRNLESEYRTWDVSKGRTPFRPSFLIRAAGTDLATKDYFTWSI